MNPLVEAIIRIAQKKRLRIVSAESVTGGRIAARFTSVSGASDVFYSGIVAYDQESKTRFLNIPHDFFEKHSVYSVECAEMMAKNWLIKCNADFCISTTGQAEESGEVFFALVSKCETRSFLKIFEGDRNIVQEQAAQYALEILLLDLEKE
jgi:PncC family amidohydrolase